MNNLKDYFNFIKDKGRCLEEINPGSDEIALTVSDAINAIKLLKEACIPILGGDILSEKDEKLIYAHQFWGFKYHFLNWYCDKEEKESQEDYLLRSYEYAKNSIIRAEKIALSLNFKCFIVLVV